jgi:NAD-dependent dihydropyrimidine dehydrogenase PreA subunit
MPPEFDLNKCEACGTCIEICPVNALEMGDEGPVVKNPEECTDCRACEAQCPNNAIKFKD